MADTFNALRGNDLIWSFFVSNYLMGKEPKPFDLLFWNSDQTRMPKALHLFYLRKFYGENALAKGELELAGERLDLGKVKTPIYVQSSKEDHIAPARSVYKGARLFGGPVTFTMAGSGHIAGVINAPAANKYQHWTNDALPRASTNGWPARWNTRLLVAALGQVAEGQVRPAGPRPRSGQGPSEAHRGRARQLRQGAVVESSWSPPPRPPPALPPTQKRRGAKLPPPLVGHGHPTFGGRHPTPPGFIFNTPPGGGGGGPRGGGGVGGETLPPPSEKATPPKQLKN